MSDILDFAGENGLVDPQQKKMMACGPPTPSSKLYIRPPTPTYLYQCNFKHDTIINLHACAVNNWQHVRL